MSRLGATLARLLERRGWEVRRRDPAIYADLESDFRALYERCAPYTMTSIERMYAVWQAVRYIVAAEVPGDLVECGVWRGGSSMLAALALESVGDSARQVCLYDTFEGMSEPDPRDVKWTGQRAADQWAASQRGRINEWCYSPLQEVEANMGSTGFPRDRLRLVKGKVEETLPSAAPSSIALLRLDTDWYESTYHELVHLFPRLSLGGVLILDDYGHWAGAREAVDRYLDETGTKLLLHRIDYTGRIGVLTANFQT